MAQITGSPITMSGRDLAFTEAFVDNGTGNHWEGNEADSPATYCFRLGLSSNYATLTGNTCYNNSSGADNVLVGIYLANAAPENTISSNFFYGHLALIAWHKISRAPNGFTNITLCGNQDLNVVTQNGIGCGGGAGPGTGTTMLEPIGLGLQLSAVPKTSLFRRAQVRAVVQSILTAAVAGQEIQIYRNIFGLQPDSECRQRQAARA